MRQGVGNLGNLTAGAQLVPTVTNCIGFAVTEIYYGN